MESRFESRGGGAKHEPKKLHMTWFIKKKKVMVDKKLNFIT